MLQGWRLRIALYAAVLALTACGSKSGAGETTDEDDGATESSSASDDDGENDGEDDDAPASGRDAGARDSGDTRRDGGSGSDGGSAAGDAGSDGEDGDSPAPGARDDAIYFRVDKFALTEPGMVLRPLLDVELPITSEVQAELDKALVSDGDPADGLVDLSMLVRFTNTSDPAAKAGKATFGGALCRYPLVASAACGPDEAIPFYEPALSYENGEDCALAGTDRVASGACFQTEPAALSLTMPMFGEVPMSDAQLVASWLDGKAIGNGWLRGFISEADAKATKLSEDLPAHAVALGIQPGTPMADFLPVGERVMGPNGPGWWFVAGFAAKPVQFSAE